MLISMAGRAAPERMSILHKAIVAEARRQQATAYGLWKSTGISLHTVQRFLAGEGSPTLDTAERIAAALGMSITAIAHAK